MISSVPQNLPKSFKNCNSVLQTPFDLGTIRKCGGFAFCVSSQLTDKNIHQIRGKDRALGNSKHLRRHVGDTSWLFIQQSHPQDQDMSILFSVSLFLISAAAWKTHIQETWLRILWGKESCSTPLGDSYSGDQPERNCFCFFPLKQIYSMSESNEMPKLQGLCSHSGFWLRLLCRDSLTWAGFGSCLVILSVNCAKLC